MTEDVTDSRDRIDMSLARGLAVLMIVNSHLESFYPYPWLADGGLIGLAIFFSCSGIGLGLSPRTRSDRLGPWYKRRLLRIYPALLITVVVFQILINQMWREWTFWQYARAMVYPTEYHFLTEILLFYVVLYFYIRWNWPGKHVVVLSALATFCLVVAIPDMVRLFQSGQRLQSGQLSPVFLWSVFLLMTLLGAWIAEHKVQFTSPLRARDFAWLLGLALAYLALKFTFAKLGRFSEWFVALFAVSMGFSYFLLRFLCHPRVVAAVQQNRLAWWALSGLGAMSLEMYLVHPRVKPWEIWRPMRFPLNILAFLAASIVASYCVYRAAQYVQGELQRRNRIQWR